MGFAFSWGGNQSIKSLQQQSLVTKHMCNHSLIKFSFPITPAHKQSWRLTTPTLSQKSKGQFDLVPYLIVNSKKLHEDKCCCLLHEKKK